MSFNDFDRSTRRTMGAIIAIMAVWMTFIAVAISVVIWGAGRFLGVW